MVGLGVRARVWGSGLVIKVGVSIRRYCLVLHIRVPVRSGLSMGKMPVIVVVSVAGPMAWNSLPDFIRDPTNSTDCFRRLLETYLFARYYCIQRIRGSQRLCAIQIHAFTHKQ